MSDTEPPTVVIDATEDYRTCPRCRHVIPAELAACPMCELVGRLTVERYTLTPQQRRRAELERVTRGWGRL